MTLTEQRLQQIGEILSRPERPSTYAEIAQHIGINKTHIGRLLNKSFDLYKVYLDNKRHQQQTKLRVSMEEIEAYMKKHDCTASYASLALGYNQSYYAKLKSMVVDNGTR